MASERRGARQKAQRAAHAAAKPLRIDLKRQRRGARRDLQQGQRANRRGYRALDRTLGDIGSDFQRGFRRLGRGYNRDVAGLTGLVNAAGQGVEGITSAGAFGDIAAGGLRNIKGQQALGLAHTRGIRSSAALERRNNAQNLVQAFRDQLADLRLQRSGVAAQEQASYLELLPYYQELAQLREQERQAEAYRQALLERNLNQLARQQQQTATPPLYYDPAVRGPLNPMQPGPL